jgi:hypothetical protein
VPDGTGLPNRPGFDIPLAETTPGDQWIFESLHPKFASKQIERQLDSPAGVTYYFHDDVGFHPDVHVYLLLYACVFWHGEADDLRIT